LSFPLQPDPITWAPGMALTAPRLRADPANLAALLAKRPILAASQQTTAQTVPGSTITPVDLDTEYNDNWNGHTIAAATYAAQLPGWYLAEGVALIGGTSTSCFYGSGIQVVQAGVTSDLLGNILCANGVDTTGPACADLVQLNPFTADTVCLFAYQNSGGSPDLATPGAYFTAQWVGLGTTFPGGEGSVNGTVVTSPQPAALWPPGSGTLITNAGGIASGATSMTVGETTGMIVGGSLGLDYYQGNPTSPMAETVTITSVTSLTVGISATSYPHGGTASPGNVSIPVSAAFMNQQVRDVINYLAYPPMLRVHGSTQTISTQSFPASTQVNLTTVTLDNFSGWSASSHEYVFPQAGVYYVYGQVPFQAAVNNYSAGISIGGGTVQWGDSVRNQTGTLINCATVRKHVRVTAGQTLTLQTSVANNNVTLESASNSYASLLAVWRGF
jgi:hypothetical protein